MMEECQISAQWQGKGNVFRGLYGFLLPLLPTDIQTVEAYANKQNSKSDGVLRHLGLGIIGENASGRSYHYRGTFADLAK